MTDIDKLIERLKDHAEAWEVKETDNRDELMNERVMAFDCLTALEEIQRLRAIEAAARDAMRQIDRALWDTGCLHDLRNDARICNLRAALAAKEGDNGKA
jgi:hypothetical protein